MTTSTSSWPFANVEPSANWRPGQRRARARKSVSHTIRHGVASMLRSLARRPDFDLPNLAELAALEHELDAAIVAAVVNLRNQGHSWEAIANELGVSRQATHKRFNEFVFERPGATGNSPINRYSVRDRAVRHGRHVQPTKP